MVKNNFLTFLRFEECCSTASGQGTPQMRDEKYVFKYM